MPAVKWQYIQRKDGNVTIKGQIRLECGHTLYESARVRDSKTAIDQGQVTVRNLLHVHIANHVNTCPTQGKRPPKNKGGR
jgi:hypothetical protein